MKRLFLQKIFETYLKKGKYIYRIQLWGVGLSLRELVASFELAELVGDLP